MIFEVFQLRIIIFVRIQLSCPCFAVDFLKLEKRYVEIPGLLGILCNSEHIHENVLREWRSSVLGITVLKKIETAVRGDKRSFSK